MTDSEPEWANQLNRDTQTKMYDSPVVKEIWHPREFGTPYKQDFSTLFKLVNSTNCNMHKFERDLLFVGLMYIY